VYQSVQNFCKSVKYCLLNSRKWLHVSRTVRRHTDRCTRYTLVVLHTKYSWFCWTPNWPSNSSDLNPVDYSFWDALQRLVYRQKFKNIDHLKQVLNSCWDTINQELINSAIDQWSKRLLLLFVVGRSFARWTLNIVSVNSLIQLCCCKLFLSWIALKMLSVLLFLSNSLIRR